MAEEDRSEEALVLEAGADLGPFNNVREDSGLREEAARWRLPRIARLLHRRYKVVRIVKSLVTEGAMPDLVNIFALVDRIVHQHFDFVVVRFGPEFLCADLVLAGGFETIESAAPVH
jgi:hypothetical protein